MLFQLVRILHILIYIAFRVQHFDSDRWRI